MLDIGFTGALNQAVGIRCWFNLSAPELWDTNGIATPLGPRR